MTTANANAEACDSLGPGDTCSVSCASGYTGTAVTYTCPSDNTSSDNEPEPPDGGSLPSCTPIVCERPSTSEYNWSGVTETLTANNFAVTGLTCAPGYEASTVGITVSPCTTSGPYILSGCQPIVCERPADHTGYTITDETGLDLSTRDPDDSSTFAVTASCADGYTGTAVVAPCSVSGPYTLSGCNGIVDCVGAYDEWSACSLDCGGGTKTRTYTVITQAENGGAECEAGDGDVDQQNCNTDACQTCGEATCPGDYVNRPESVLVECAGTTCDMNNESDKEACCVPKATCVSGPYIDINSVQQNGPVQCGSEHILNNAQLNSPCQGAQCDVSSNNNDDYNLCCVARGRCAVDRCPSGTSLKDGVEGSLCRANTCEQDECCEMSEGVDTLSPLTCLENYSKVGSGNDENCVLNLCNTNEIVNNLPNGYVIEPNFSGNNMKDAEDISSNIQCSPDFVGSPSVRCIPNLTRCMNGNIVCIDNDTGNPINDQGDCAASADCTWDDNQFRIILEGCFESDQSCAYYDSQTPCLDSNKNLIQDADNTPGSNESVCCEERTGFCINNTNGTDFPCPENSILTQDNTKLVSEGECCTNRTGYCIDNFNSNENYKSRSSPGGTPGIQCPISNPIVTTDPNIVKTDYATADCCLSAAQCAFSEPNFPDDPGCGPSKYLDITKLCPNNITNCSPELCCNQRASCRDIADGTGVSPCPDTKYYNENNYCLSETCNTANDVDGESSECCLEREECNGTDIDCGEQIINTDNLCLTDECGQADSTRCCVDRAKCESLKGDDNDPNIANGACGEGYIYNEANNQVDCNGINCSVTVTDGARSDDHTTCCLLKATCGNKNPDDPPPTVEIDGEQVPSPVSVSNSDCLDNYIYNTDSSSEYCDGRPCDTSTKGQGDHEKCCILERYCREDQNPAGDLAVTYYDEEECKRATVDRVIDGATTRLTFNGINASKVDALTPGLDEDAVISQCCIADGDSIIDVTLIGNSIQRFTNMEINNKKNIIEGMENEERETCDRAHDEIAQKLGLTKSQIIMDCKKDDKNRFIFNMKLISTEDRPVKVSDINKKIKNGLNIPSIGGITKLNISNTKKKTTNKIKYIFLFVILILIVIIGIIGYTSS